MPKRTDIKSVLIIGAGPIVIGQACEFDYSGAQACKALREEGIRVILVNSNPATIMTDPAMADATYIEPIEWRTVEKIIAKERPDAILPTMGGQTALNCALDLNREGILDKYNVELIGASVDAIDKAEDRDRFREAMVKIGLDMPRSEIVNNMEEAMDAVEKLGFPSIIRPSFTMGGSGGGIAYNREEFDEICHRGFDLSPTSELQIDESIIGWKEFEMEVVRDHKDNCIIVCSIENFDAMGVHTGDSITVAPAQTLTDKEYQLMRNASIAVLREIGVDTGGSNVQFGVSPVNGRLVVIEMNPRVSRSSALASKATGFPIAKIAAKLAIGYTLDELQNDITGGQTPASFEPSIDYVVTKIPRFNFEKFPEAEPRLSTQMKSVGEVMAIGRTFQESFQKALRGLETGLDGLDPIIQPKSDEDFLFMRNEINQPGPERFRYLADGFRAGMTAEELFKISHVDPWFLAQMEDLLLWEAKVEALGFDKLDQPTMRRLKRKGFSDRRLASLLSVSEQQVREQRHQQKVFPVYKRVDTCAAEFATDTAYLYSTYEEECEAAPTSNTKYMVLGGGPNRIGQGIEFDYCCVHAAMALKSKGFETIMVNCNPETVSTDYDTSDRLYFEPLTLEDVLEIVRIEQPAGVIVQYGGQTPLKLAEDLEAAGVPIMGTPPSAIDQAEDRERFQQMIEKLGLLQPPNRTARSLEEGLVQANEIGYPLVVRPSYVLGGRAMEIVHSDEDLARYMTTAVSVSNDSPVLLDRFLDDAIEADVDAICDKDGNVLVAGIMEHIEQAGVHSGDSACSLPPYSLGQEVQQVMREQVAAMGRELGVIGLMNTQFAIKGDQVYILEVNPRASRTVPFVSKATGMPVANIAALCMAGYTLPELGVEKEIIPPYFSVKEAVLPFAKFQGVDPILGPEMKSTGEVMGVGDTFGAAFYNAVLGGNQTLPESGRVLISVRDADKPAAVVAGKMLLDLGFELVATGGTAAALQEAGLECIQVNKMHEGRPHLVDMIKNDEIAYVVNTTEGRQSIRDSFDIRRSALQHQVSYTTTLAGARATALALADRLDSPVHRLQDLHTKVSG
ncbi:carbamoyl-phosphate synthase large subunit [Pelagibaculum spongiae]|uniref:Carbamoyl phosphate synthase large chain n=1 Tax=Pelagibaculum spongiae TaxID=2080658 RepID=A0A2V1H6D0_9GAMM|nr:carbamoyl-phosphate synthase large subunit [Pelagibaculum spongiae]PVZ71982.1 carbamoyl phosphate synthase large subunit [Pelagibaculum spongiae]